jgi:signal transduction histidine kinase
VVRNLLDNALKYSPDGTPIDVIVHADMSKSGWSMEVRNPVGRAGFPDPDRVFEKFWRSPRASYRSGSGQGLFIAWRLAQLMGGQLHYVPDKDCVSFRLELPMQMPKTKEAST